MNFLNLLNPWVTNGLESVGQQQRHAEINFPVEVAKSRLILWFPGDPFRKKGIRFLIGVAATYCLPELRFLDVINKHLRDNESDIAIDVFDLSRVTDAAPYFEKKIEILRTPAIGMWRNGKLERVELGGGGMDLVLQTLGMRIIARQLTAGLSPPPPELMEQYEV